MDPVSAPQVPAALSRPAPSHGSVPRWGIVAGAVLALAGAVSVAALVWPHSPVAFWVSNCLSILCPLVSGAVAIRQGLQLHGRGRQTWVLLGAAAWTWALGSLAYAWYEAVLREPRPALGPSDVGYALAGLVFIAGLARYPTLSSHVWSVARAGADTVLIMAATLLIVVTLVIRPAVDSRTPGEAERFSDIVPPYASVLLMSMILLLLIRTPAGAQAALRLLFAATALLVLADTFYVLMSARGTYFTGSWVDPLWWTGFALIGLAALAYQDPGPLPPPRPPGLREVLTPYLVALVAIVVAVIGLLTGSRLGTVEMVLIVVVLVALFIRQALLAFDTIDMAEELHHSAYHDLLTELPNRRSLEDHVARVGLSDQRVSAILLMDLDGFKEINDSLGHTTGDRLLRETAARLSTTVTGPDLLARLGGDEFAVVLMAGSDARGLADRLLTLMRDPFQVAGTTLSLSVSIGIAPAMPGVGWEDLLRNADLAMYQAKALGRNRASTFLPALHEQSKERLELSIALHDAVERDEFRMLYQPIVELATGRISGVEGLLRWQRPDRLVPPDEFLPVLAATDLIITVGDWSIDRACADLAAWRAQGHEHVRVAVNVAPRQLWDAQLVPRVAEILKRQGIPADLLSIEITEAVILDDIQTQGTVRAALASFRELGVRLALDDFGTGYASLSTLRTVPVNTIKVDRSFIAELETGGSATVDSLAYMAHRYDIEVVAEGVETVRQLERLRDTGIRLAQGYLFSRPVDSAEILRLLADPQATAASATSAPGAPLVHGGAQDPTP